MLGVNAKSTGGAETEIIGHAYRPGYENIFRPRITNFSGVYTIIILLGMFAAAFAYFYYHLR